MLHSYDLARLIDADREREIQHRQALMSPAPSGPRHPQTFDRGPAQSGDTTRGARRLGWSGGVARRTLVPVPRRLDRSPVG